ncbi:MAG: hypothetical protein COV75_04520 [Candidatus Omnitrophica bacterium CG11_big_fil_rev_8_21_14_0_20_63_9]|nr:MAG: hypothetical protein COV75_04520 [Candidatus Omnitrophica bacterium CG11_big_fil_rev_8_21_14_0_20_63_9]
MDCPKCSVGKLNGISVTVNTLYRSQVLQGQGTTVQLHLEQCFSCNGVWFDAGELKKYLAEELTILDSAPIAKELKRELDEKHAKCPKCQVEMVKQQAEKNRSVTVDACPRCHGIWLDAEELDHLELKQLGRLKRFGIELENFFRSLIGKGNTEGL